MRSLVRVVAAVARNRALSAVMVAYGVFSATQNAAWIAMLVYAYDRGGAGTAGAVAIAQLLPAALLTPGRGGHCRPTLTRRCTGRRLPGPGRRDAGDGLGDWVGGAAGGQYGGRGRLRCGGHDQTGTDSPGPRVGAQRREAHRRQRPDGLDRERQPGRLQRC